MNISDALLAELKARASDTGRTFREVLEETLRLGLAGGTGGTGKSRFRVKPHPLGLKPGFHGVSLNQLYDQLEAEDSSQGGQAGSEPSLRVAEESP